MQHKRKAEDSPEVFRPISYMLDKMRNKLDEIREGRKIPKKSKHTTPDGLCKIHGGKVVECNNVRLVFESDTRETYMSKNYITSLLQDKASKNRLRTRYTKSGKYEKITMTFRGSEDCDCVAAIKKAKAFSGGFATFILESGLENEFKRFFQPEAKRLEKMSFKYLLN